MPRQQTDVQVTNSGSMFVFELCSDAAREWVEQNVAIEPHMWLGENAFACEHGYARDLANGMLTDGLCVQ